eukprot:CAMPEP_0197289140 /NCGR_PEP_ID=MMETSP0890-20130614/6344_1 /TAXON_ID=44058 ORGANISM="Aureoumbra lagunensis, Strain CCMP1510" /NCGR_SAMPLE_ID=MMETSP0890 /ASSEMBLY_ACC=CAM_ASM_000533 /LENGTH=312 /DNA_ID=CAMNT_0042760323 /DNA_START=150 /DNA_END=1088 /DNA_ORIENTATION=+
MVKLASKQVLALALAVSAGVMLYVSFVEILVKSQVAFEGPLGPSDAYMAATASLFGGMIFMGAVDVLVHRLDPQHDANHSSDPQQFVATQLQDEAALASAVELGTLGNCEGGPAAADKSTTTSNDETTFSQISPKSTSSKDMTDIANEKNLLKHLEPRPDELKRMGVMTAIAIGLHNFPEGLATFVATIAEPTVGIALSIAIAIHNIPEGLCVAMPIYFACGDRWRAFRWAILSGISEPIGALLGWIVLAHAFNQVIYGIIFGAVAGMMVMIVLHELLPTAHKYDPNDQVVTKGFCAGMAIMAASLILFVYA